MYLRITQNVQETFGDWNITCGYTFKGFYVVVGQSYLDVHT